MATRDDVAARMTADDLSEGVTPGTGVAWVLFLQGGATTLIVGDVAVYEDDAIFSGANTP